MKDLQLMMMMIIGLALILFGIQLFLQKDKRKVASDMLKAATLMMTGIFMIYYWQMQTPGSAGGLRPIMPSGLSGY
jgi:heme O synthase-like polyprenyltransferase